MYLRKISFCMRKIWKNDCDVGCDDYYDDFCGEYWSRIYRRSEIY